MSIWYLGGGGMELHGHMLPTIDAGSVGLPANTIYIRPSDGRLYRTV